MITIRRVALWLLCTLAAAPALAGAAFVFEQAPGRLPKNVVPLEYRVSVTPHLEERTIAGTESVTLRMSAATATIVFNSLNEKLTDVRLDGAAVSAVASDDARQLTTVTLAQPAPAGEHTLSFAYSALLETQPHGMFLQPYQKPDGSRAVLVSTKMESTDARRMFPCWDEPAFRATFELTVTVPAAWATVSNMPVASRDVHGELATTTFQRSPAMPSYLIEFTGGDLAAIRGRTGSTEVGLWAVRGREREGQAALAYAQQILGDYNEYFGYTFPLPKLDAIAVPGGFTGAMENWGAITYNDRLLLLNSDSTIADRQTVFAVQAHEIAHQWNGDLVTMGWWDDLWLNESFASWRAAEETELRNPSWKWWQRQDADKERAMRSDARLSTHPIQQPVADELQAANAFDEITYEKGQSVLRMLDSYLGPQVFRDGIRRYLRARAFSNATAADLWLAVAQASGRDDVVLVARDWTEQPGFPLVTVAAACDASGLRTLTFTQQRFVLQADPGDVTRWRVPLRIRTGDSAPRAELLARDGQTSAAGRCDEPLSVNADAIGFFRVKYDAATLATNTRGFAGLPDGDRIALLDDAWALGLAGDQPLGSYLALAAAMGHNHNARAWDQIAGALGALERDERGSPGHEGFIAAARSLIKPMADSLGWDPRAGDTPDILRLRRTLHAELGAWNDASTLAEARARFGRFVTDRSAIRPDDQEGVLGTVARAADAATFEQLHRIAREEKDEAAQRRYYLALMQVGDDALAERAVQAALSAEIPPQAAGMRLHLIVALAGRHPALAWRTFMANADLLLAPYPKYAPLITSQDVPEVFWDAADPHEVETWVRARLPAEMTANIARGMEAARVRRAERIAMVPAADAWVAATGARSPIAAR
ncbi:MAG TPA: M1 family aminopeptidase [Steroidobacteraceae bacterium]|jgi:aminopeptidase N|nr:M1 family aminopeptidase [Steroidobacteraceae bacterium]